MGVEIEKEGTKEIVGSGVRGGSADVITSAGASNKVLELIHFSSDDLNRGGDSGKSLKLSAKWSLMNL